MSNLPHTHEDAARFGSTANALLGLGQASFGLLTGNIGFISESVHQAADAVSLGAKANAMNAACSPIRALRLRKFAASILLAGSLVGIGGGLKHIQEGSTENHGPLEIAGAIAGAVVNSAIARKSHSASVDHEVHGTHHHGAAHDSTVHIMTDTATGWIYTAALLAESRLPGISNAALIANGAIIGGAGIHTWNRIAQDERSAR